MSPAAASDLFAILRPGDEVRSFRNSDVAWKTRRGRQGYVVLRQGRVVKVLVVTMN